MGRYQPQVLSSRRQHAWTGYFVPTVLYGICKRSCLSTFPPSSIIGEIFDLFFLWSLLLSGEVVVFLDPNDKPLYVKAVAAAIYAFTLLILIISRGRRGKTKESRSLYLAIGSSRRFFVTFVRFAVSTRAS